MTVYDIWAMLIKDRSYDSIVIGWTLVPKADCLSVTKPFSFFCIALIKCFIYLVKYSAVIYCCECELHIYAKKDHGELIDYYTRGSMSKGGFYVALIAKRNSLLKFHGHIALRK
jgi:hypothetical protein